MFLGVKAGFCHITVDFAIAASQNDVCKTQQIHVCFATCLIIKDESINLMIFGHFLNTISFIMTGKLVNTKPFCDAAVAKSTVM